MKRLLALALLAVLAGCTMGPAPQATPEQPVTLIAEDLAVPWDVAQLPSGDLLVTQRPGEVLRISDGEPRTISEVPVRDRGEGGLLGLALHPEFATNNLVYLYQTIDAQDGTQNRVVRYELTNDGLREERVIINDIPGASYHDGGRIRFGPDGLLYITTGDAGDEKNAQERDSLAGKILRLTPDGDVPANNPYGTPIYSWGHRNPQGLAWDAQGRLWSTEHGRSGVRSGFDEINLITPGTNYGWPDIQGDQTQAGMSAPVAHSGPETTWAPASAAVHNGTLYFGGLRGGALYATSIQESGVGEVRRVLEGYGRIRTVRVIDESLYVTTSNTDGRGSPAENDDRLLRISPEQLS